MGTVEAESAVKIHAVAGAVTSSRLVSLDAFRGMTIAGMILVNNAGNWDAVWWPLDHAAWNEWTPTDLIFPFFLFIMGVSMVLSFEARRQRGATRGSLMRHAVRRSVIIYAIGFALALWGKHWNLHTVRFYGVLARIAVVYLVASVIVLYCGRKTRVVIGAAALIGYWLLMTRVPGFDLSMDGNLAGYIDRKLLYEHLWIKHRFDPEGLLSTIPAVVTTLIGQLAGFWLRGAGGEQPRLSRDPARTGHPGGVVQPVVEGRRPMARSVSIVQGLLIAAGVMMVLGELWGVWFPINKNLWTSSYVLFTGGFAMAMLAACYWAIEIRGWKTWARPFVWYGSNAIALFAGSTALGVATTIYHLRSGATLKAWVYGTVFAPVAPAKLASAMYGMAYVVVFGLVAWAMYRRKLFVKV